MRMHHRGRVALTLALFAFGPAVAHADLINFAGLTTTSPEAPIPNGYAGFTWNNLNALNTQTDANVLPSGYARADVDSQSPNVAFNVFGQPASMTSSTPFSFYGAFFTAAWRDNLKVDVSGYRDGVLLYDKKFRIDSTGYSFESFDFEGIDTLDFSSSGGKVHGYVPGKPLSHPPLTQFAMDDLVFVPGGVGPDSGPSGQGVPAPVGPAPEPAGALLGGFGAIMTCLGAWLGIGRKKVFPTA
jgi:hypothetical protein